MLFFQVCGGKEAKWFSAAAFSAHTYYFYWKVVCYSGTALKATQKIESRHKMVIWQNKESQQRRRQFVTLAIITTFFLLPSWIPFPLQADWEHCFSTTKWEVFQAYLRPFDSLRGPSLIGGKLGMSLGSFDPPSFVGESKQARQGSFSFSKDPKKFSVATTSFVYLETLLQIIGKNAELKTFEM